MNKNFIIVLFTILLIFITSCNENQQDRMLTSSDLYQTIWKGTIEGFNGDEMTGRTPLILEFLTSSSGKCIRLDENDDPIENGFFSYRIEDKIISFSKDITGDWYIINYDTDSLILQSYSPHKLIMTLSKIY